MCFVGVLNARVVAFLAVVHTGCTLVGMFKTYNLEKLRVDISLSKAWMLRPCLREHRTVVLPEYQGIGLGSLMADSVAHALTKLGYNFMSTTAHPTYGGYRDRSPLWVALPTSKRERGDGKCSTFSHIWRGTHCPEECSCNRGAKRRIGSYASPAPPPGKVGPARKCDRGRRLRLLRSRVRQMVPLVGVVPPELAPAPPTSPLLQPQPAEPPQLPPARLLRQGFSERLSAEQATSSKRRIDAEYNHTAKVACSRAPTPSRATMPKASKRSRHVADI